MEIKSAQKAVDEWIKTHGVKYFSELTNTVILMEEVGELARVVSRTYGEQSFKEGEENCSLKEELGDVLFVIMCIANQTGTDLTIALKESLEKKTRRDAQRHQNNPKLNG